NLLRTCLGQGPATFELSAASAASMLDAALGLYDANGNLLASANQDLQGKPGSESLTANLDSRRVYVVGAFFDGASLPETFRLTVTPAAQISHAPLRIDPGTGNVELDAVSGEDLFNSSTDVDYYPLDLTNAGAAGTVTVKPLGLDVHPHAALFRRDSD